MTGDDYYALVDQINILTGRLTELAGQVARLVDEMRILRYDLDTLKPPKP